MTVRARSRAARRAAVRLRHVSTLSAAAAACLFALPARAQVSASINVESDERLRGYSISAGKPVATVQVGYDDDSGIYASVAATATIDRDPRFLGLQGNLGYAKRLGQRWSIEGGVLRSEYRAAYPGGRTYRYTEIYAGLTRDPLSVRLSWSPDYFSGRPVLYGEVSGAIVPAKDWRIDLHGGVLGDVGQSVPGYRDKLRYDWRAGLGRRFGAFDLHAALSGGGPGREYYRLHYRRRTVLTAGASWSF